MLGGQSIAQACITTLHSNHSREYNLYLYGIEGFYLCVGWEEGREATYLNGEH